MNRDAAETLALKALAWLAGDDELMQGFLATTGIGAAELGDAASAPETLAAVLDFLMQDDAKVIGFCGAEGISCDMPARARQALPGGDEVHWT